MSEIQVAFVQFDLYKKTLSLHWHLVIAPETNHYQWHFINLSSTDNFFPILIRTVTDSRGPGTSSSYFHRKKEK